MTAEPGAKSRTTMWFADRSPQEKEFHRFSYFGVKANKFKGGTTKVKVQVDQTK